MFWFKACPRCHGDLTSDHDTYGPYVSCIQCGHYLSQAEESGLGTLKAQPDQLSLVSADPIRLAA